MFNYTGNVVTQTQRLSSELQTVVANSGDVTKQMLELYGKTYVTFRKYEDGTYLLDF